MVERARVSLAILIAATLLSLGTAFRWFDIRFRVGPYFVTHWLALMGSLFIATFTPLYYVMKRRYPRSIKSLIGVHMFGNLLSFTVISMHLAQQLTRPVHFPQIWARAWLYTSSWSSWSRVVFSTGSESYRV